MESSRFIEERLYVYTLRAHPPVTALLVLLEGHSLFALDFRAHGLQVEDDAVVRVVRLVDERIMARVHPEVAAA